LVALCLLAAVVPAFASNAGHVVIRDNVAPSKRDELVQKLRAIAGLPTLDFDREGVLLLGSGSHKSGSQNARELLAQAISGDKLIVIEDASSRADVAFCRVVPARIRTQGGTKLHAYVVLIDFADFRRLLGDDEARAAFDVGWGFLHEIDHVVADSKDPDEQGLLGDCEGHINLMRSELGLPLRVEYFFTESHLKTNPNFGTKLVRLAFEQYDVRKARTRRYWLMWDSVAVGGLTTTSQTAVLRLGSSQ
jgi:hypothetical protein